MKVLRRNYESTKDEQLTTTRKDVVWKLENIFNSNAIASIDSRTGQIKAKCAGKVYVSVTTKDQKYHGITEIYFNGPVISDPLIQCKTITIKKDRIFTTGYELLASGMLPKTGTMKYKNGKKTGQGFILCNSTWRILPAI